MNNKTNTPNTPASQGRTFAEIRGFGSPSSANMETFALVPEHLRTQMTLAGTTPFMTTVDMEESFDEESGLLDPLNHLCNKLFNKQLTQISASKNPEEILEAMIKHGVNSTIKVANQELADVRSHSVSNDLVISTLGKLLKVGLIQPLNGTPQKVEVSELRKYINSSDDLKLFLASINGSKDEEVVKNIITFLQSTKH